jgi:molybdopterin-guanine dinucleotide biosynthesis protein A
MGETAVYEFTAGKAAAVGLVLAGGLSRRMGGPEKAFLPLAGKPLIGHVIDRLAKQVDAVVINANGDPARFAAFALPVIADTIPGFAGPLAGILAAMRWTAHRHPTVTHVISVAADTPFFPADLAARLSQAVGQNRRAIALASSGGNRHPVFGCWPVALADELEAFLNSGQGGKVMLFARAHAVEEVPFAEIEMGGKKLDPFFNINTPEEFETARAVAEEASHGASA